MPTETFTAQFVERLKPPPSGRVDYFDEKLTGLGLRASFTGKKTWFLHYRKAGDPRKQRLTIGEYPVLSLADAREKAQEALLKAKRGEDPSGEKRAHKASPTFRDLVDEYLERHASKKRTSDEQRRILMKEFVPAWGPIKARDVTRRDVIAAIERIVDRGKPVMANRSLSVLSRVFNWGMKKGLIELNPALGLEPPGEEASRERVLTDDEIKKVWVAFDSAGPAGPLFKLLLILGQRKGETMNMRWADLDLESGVWIIPPEFAKNETEHRVPLPGLAIEILCQLKAKADGRKVKSPWVFPSKVGQGAEPLSNVQKNIDAVRTESGVSFWPHDLRRTVATGLAQLGISRFTIGKVLNHTTLAEKGLARITAVYDRHSYDAEKREALTLWAEALEATLKPSVGKVE